MPIPAAPAGLIDLIKASLEVSANAWVTTAYTIGEYQPANQPAPDPIDPTIVSDPVETSSIALHSEPLNLPLVFVLSSTGEMLVQYLGVTWSFDDGDLAATLQAMGAAFATAHGDDLMTRLGG